MKYLHLFNEQADYDNEKNSLILPSASLIKQNNHVEYSPHQYVEIAGIKWATMNVGAKSITDYGLYFQWGDTQGYTADQVGTGEGKKEFSSGWTDYKFTTDGGRTFSKYNDTDGNTILDLEDDAVHAAWGGSWRMPTTGDMQTVYEAIQASAVTANWTSEYNGTSVAGYEFHDKNSNDTLFLPACGFADDGVVNYAGVYGYYWLSSLLSANVSNANFWGLFNGSVNWFNYRFFGFSVRGVLDDKLANQS